MKKIIIIAITILTTGFVSSCSKDNSVIPAKSKSVTTVADKSELGQGD